MNKVQLVKNEKASKAAGKPVYFMPSSNGKWLRLQVASKGHVIRNGFETAQNMTGFLYVQNEERAKEYVALAMGDNMQLPGKVIYVDQLEPISTEAAEYGKQYPYPFRYGKTELTVEQRVAIQTACVEAGLALQQSGRPIYRRKMYTDDLNATSVTLTPDNQDEVNNFIGKLLSASVDPNAAKEARYNELKALGAAKRKAANTQEEYLELAEELGK